MPGALILPTWATFVAVSGGGAINAFEDEPYFPNVANNYGWHAAPEFGSDENTPSEKLGDMSGHFPDWKSLKFRIPVNSKFVLITDSDSNLVNESNVINFMAQGYKIEYGYNGSWVEIKDLKDLFKSKKYRIKPLKTIKINGIKVPAPIDFEDIIPDKQYWYIDSHDEDGYSTSYPNPRYEDAKVWESEADIIQVVKALNKSFE